MHALGFTEQPEYVVIAERGFNVVFAGRDFANWLVDLRLLTEIDAADAQKGDLVFYFSHGQFKHAGIIFNDNRVISKWGTGHLFEHGLFEIPDSYGTEARFFKSLSYEAAIEAFGDFAREKGMLL